VSGDSIFLLSALERLSQRLLDWSKALLSRHLSLIVPLALAANLLLAASLLIFPRAAASAITHDLLGGGLYVLALALSAYLLAAGIQRPTDLVARARRLLSAVPPVGIWLIAVLFWAIMLRLGYRVSVEAGSFFFPVPFLAWAALAGLGIVAAGIEPASPLAYPPERNRRPALLLALAFGLLALIRDAFLVWGYGYSISPDSIGYIALGKLLFARALPLSGAALGDQAAAFDPTSLNIRTLPYPLMNALAHSARDPLTLVWAQIAIGAAAVGALVYVIGGRDRLLGVVAGALLSLNVLWGASNRAILTEGAFTSFHVLSLAVLLHHFDRREESSFWGVLLAGALYGWTFTFRPTGLPLLVLMPVLYLWITRSWRKAGGVLAGALAVVLLSASFYGWRTGHFRLFGEGGIYSAFPLFTYHLFSPENGPVSRQIDAGLRACEGHVEYSAFTRRERNPIIKGQYIPCLRSQGWSEAEIADRFGDAYHEAILSHPAAFAAAVAYENALFLTYPVMEGVPEQLIPLIGRCEGYEWCETITDTRLPAEGALSRFFAAAASTPIQLYRLLGPRAGGGQTVADLFAWLILVGVLILTTRGRARFIALVCAALVHYLGLAVTVGFIYLPRYTYVLSPFHGLLSALLVVTVLRTSVRRSALPRRALDQSAPQRAA
jgi:hypothetical protein